MPDLFTPKYTTSDVGRLGIKRERLKEWTSKGFIAPSVAASGPGTKSLFSLMDLYQIKLFEHIIGFGFLREEAAFRVGVFGRSQKTLRSEADDFQKKALSKSLHEMVGSHFIVLSDRRDEQCPSLFQMVLEGQKLDFDPYKDSNYLLVVNFKKIREAVDSAIK